MNHRFHVDTAFVEWEKVNGDTRYHKHAIIMLKDLKANISIVHPLTAFVFWKWKYKEYNTQRLQATHLCQFLNYILVEKRSEIKLKSLSDLTFSHGTRFLNDLLAKGNSNQSVKNIERTMTQFYKYLAGKNCSVHYSVDDFIVKERQYLSKPYYYVSPFKPRYSREFANLVNKERKPVEHTLPPRYLFAFLRTSIRVARPVALGIYFAMFGGLRAGEVANIRHTDVTPYGDTLGKGGIKLNISLRNLRTDIRDTAGTSRVKRDRFQFVYNVKGALPILYEEHLKYIQGFYDDTSPHPSDALFINRDGKAMTGKSIRYYLDKVRMAFIDELAQSSNPDDVITSVNLQSTKWSFHIGRGTFTNLLAKAAKNPYEIALARGDRSIFSALTYMADTEEMKRQIESLLDEIYQDGYLMDSGGIE